MFKTIKMYKLINNCHNAGNAISGTLLSIQEDFWVLFEAEIYRRLEYI